MEKYAIRVDIIDYEDTHQRMQRFLDKLSKYLVYEEVAAKTKKLHLQGVVHYDGREKDLRDVWDDCFPSDPWEAKKLKKKSLAKARSEKYEIYITKDNNLKYNKNYSEEEINNLYKQSYQKEEEKKEKKPSFQQIVSERFDEAVAKLGTDEWVVSGRRITNVRQITRDVLIAWLVKEFSTLGKLWDTPVITKYANFLHYRIDPEGHTDAFVMACRDRW